MYLLILIMQNFYAFFINLNIKIVLQIYKNYFFIYQNVFLVYVTNHLWEQKIRLENSIYF